MFDKEMLMKALKLGKVEVEMRRLEIVEKRLTRTFEGKVVILYRDRRTGSLILLAEIAKIGCVRLQRG